MKKIVCIPEAAKGLKEKARDRMQWLDKLMEDKQFIAGDNITLADIVLFCSTDFLNTGGQPVEEEMQNISAWYERMKQRPSAINSVHEQTSVMGLPG